MSLIGYCLCLLGWGVYLVPQSLDERFNTSAVAFMKAMFEKALEVRLAANCKLSVLSMFAGVYIEDGSSNQLPASLESLYKGCGGGASAAGVKFNLRYDYQGAGLEVSIHDGVQSDAQHTLRPVPKGSLSLRDLGYHHLGGFEAIEQSEAYYISRYKFGVKVYLSTEKDTKSIDLQGIISKMKVGEIIELAVYIGKQKRLPTRLILQKLPEQVAAERRRKLKNDKQNKRKNISEGRLAFCDVVAFVTNIDLSMLEAEQVMNIYRLRWQIELLFKVWKSVFKIDKVSKMKAARYECLLYGRLILILIYTQVFTFFKIHFWNKYQFLLSEFIAFKIMVQDLALWIQSGFKKSKLLQLMRYLWKAFTKFARKNIRKGKKPIHEIICV